MCRLPLLERSFHFDDSRCRCFVQNVTGKAPSDRETSAKRPEKVNGKLFHLSSDGDAAACFSGFSTFQLSPLSSSLGWSSVVIRMSRSHCQHSSTNRPTNRLNLSQKKKTFYPAHRVERHHRRCVVAFTLELSSPVGGQKRHIERKTGELKSESKGCHYTHGLLSAT